MYTITEIDDMALSTKCTGLLLLRGLFKILQNYRAESIDQDHRMKFEEHSVKAGGTVVLDVFNADFTGHLHYRHAY